MRSSWHQSQPCSIISMGIGQVIISHSVKQGLLSIKETRRSNCHTIAVQFFISMRMLSPCNIVMSHILPDTSFYLGTARSLCKIPRYTKLCALISPLPPTPASNYHLALRVSFSPAFPIVLEPEISPLSQGHSAIGRQLFLLGVAGREQETAGSCSDIYGTNLDPGPGSCKLRDCFSHERKIQSTWETRIRKYEFQLKTWAVWIS